VMRREEGRERARALLGKEKKKTKPAQTFDKVNQESAWGGVTTRESEWVGEERRRRRSVERARARRERDLRKGREGANEAAVVPGAR
jgi:hypothetical protein